MIENAKKDQQSTNAEWELPKSKIDGVIFRESKNIITSNGHTTEGYREDWHLHDEKIRHIISVNLRQNAISAWHIHKFQIDHIFVIAGTLQVALYDDREDSSSYKQLEVRNISHLRPGVLVIPPGIWHGLKNISDKESIFINYFNNAYRYDDPDEYRLPVDSDKIPFSFK